MLLHDLELSGHPVQRLETSCLRSGITKIRNDRVNLHKLKSDLLACFLDFLDGVLLIGHDWRVADSSEILQTNL